MRRLTLVILFCLVATVPAATAARGLRAERQRSHAVLAQVAAVNRHLDVVMQQWDGARVRLLSLEGSLRANERVLRISRANLSAAQQQLEQRLYDLYVQPSAGALDVFAGATSINDLINRLAATHALAAQDLAIATQAQRLHRTVAHREALLRANRRQVVRAIATLAAERAAISRALAREQRLLATIHENIRRLTEAAAEEQRRRAAAERAQIARRVEAARGRAASTAITAVQSPVLVPDPHPTSPATASPPAPPGTPAPPPTPAPPAAPGATPSASSGHPDAAAIAARYLGVPYVWGGESPAGFDCSGLVAYVYAQLGVSLPHYTVSQWDATIPITDSDLAPGDLVFFDGLGHVGIYIGGGQFIHAPHPGTVVQIGTLTGYWAANMDGARRVP